MTTVAESGYVVEFTTCNNPRFRYIVSIRFNGETIQEGKFATQNLADYAYFSWIEAIKKGEL